MYPSAHFIESRPEILFRGDARAQLRHCDHRRRQRSARFACAIVGFELAVERVEGKLKLSQNRSPDDRRRVREQLQGSTDPMARDAAGWNAWRIRPWTAPSESLNLPG